MSNKKPMTHSEHMTYFEDNAQVLTSEEKMKINFHERLVDALEEKVIEEWCEDCPRYKFDINDVICKTCKFFTARALLVEIKEAKGDN